jgi:group I intron endonuclease
MIIYLTTNLINGKKYIGQDSYNNPNYLGSGFLLKKAIAKYGIENFKKEILEECQNKEELDSREKYWIKIYNAVKNETFYNISDGGQGGKLGEIVNEKRKISLMGHKVSDSTRKKISESHKGKKDSELTKKKKSLSHKNVKHYWLTNYQKGGDKNPRAFPVYQFSDDNLLIKMWSCQKEASDTLKIGKSSISSCINGKQKTAGGFIWKKITNN